jgi:hypothetical protein
VKEAHEHLYYRAQLLKPLVWVLPRRLWGKWVKVAGWTLYDRDWLVAKFEEWFWPVECRGGALNARFEIEGRDDEEHDWEAVSEWRRGELRMADDIAGAVVRKSGGKVVVGRAAERGRRRGSGTDTLVRHLRDVEGVRDYRRILEVLKACGIDWIGEAVKGWEGNELERVRGAYARGKQAHAEACDYCAFGLPKEVEDALARRKRR